MQKSVCELFNSESVVSLTRSFAFSTGMGVVITDVNGCHVSPETNFCEFCKLMNRESAQQCYRSNKFALGVAIQTGKPFVFVCHAGLVDMIAPIRVNHRVVGSLMAGQVRVDSTMNLPRAGVHGMIRMNEPLREDLISETTQLRLNACAQMLPLVAELIARHLTEAEHPSTILQSKIHRPSEAALAPYTDADGRTWLRHNYALHRWLDLGEFDRAKMWISDSIDLTRYLTAPQSATLKVSTQCRMVESYFRLQTDIDESLLDLDMHLDQEVLDWCLPAYFLLDLIADGLAGGPEVSKGVLRLQSSKKGNFNVLSIRDMGQGILPLCDDKQTWSLFTADHVLAEEFSPAFKKALFDLLSGSHDFHVDIFASPDMKRVDVLCDMSYKHHGNS